MLHSECGPRDITFSHKDGTTGKFRLFNITALERAVKLDQSGGCIVVESLIDESFRDMYLHRMGIEEHRMARLKPPFPPVLGAFERNGKVTIVDGAHRMAYAYRNNWTHFQCLIISPTVWEPCLIDLKSFGEFIGQDVENNEQVQQTLLGGDSWIR